MHPHTPETVFEKITESGHLLVYPTQELVAAALRGDPSVMAPLAPSHPLLLERVRYTGNGVETGTALPREGWADSFSSHQIESFKHKFLYPHVASPQALHAVCIWLLEAVPAWR
jgi:hypothetical protein